MKKPIDNERTTIIGLTRATCEAIEMLLDRDTIPGLVHNGFAWKCDEFASLQYGSVILCKLEWQTAAEPESDAAPEPRVIVATFHDVLDANERAELTELLALHASTHGVQILV